MAYTVTIYGAGSIGNHLAHACRNRGWAVTICDPDPLALERTEKQIYPQRYGQWDQEIRLVKLEGSCCIEPTDLVIIGTPPDVHIKLALSVLGQAPPRVMLIEKPLCPPTLEGCPELAEMADQTGTKILVGYNHTLTDQTHAAGKLLARKSLGEPLYLSAAFREHWSGIFGAHPWLSGPEDSYLGYSARGGGAGGEHSHAINIWQHFARILGAGRISEVSAMIDRVRQGRCDYDRVILINARTEKGLTGHIAQDVVTRPPKKKLTIMGSEAMLEWQVNRDAGHDALFHTLDGGGGEEILFPKKRPDDFRGELEHVEDLLEGKTEHSPISLQYGFETMLVLAAAHLSCRRGRTVTIDYRAGCRPEALAEQ